MTHSNPVGCVSISPDAMPLRYKVTLDATAAEALAWPDAVTVNVSGGVATIAAATATTDGARPTWAAAGGLACVVRVGENMPISEAHKGRHVAALRDGALVADLTHLAPRARR